MSQRWQVRAGRTSLKLGQGRTSELGWLWCSDSAHSSAWITWWMRECGHEGLADEGDL